MSNKRNLDELNILTDKILTLVAGLRIDLKLACEHTFVFLQVERCECWATEHLNTTDIWYKCYACKQEIKRVLSDHCKAELDGLLKLGLITMEEYSKAQSDDNKIMTSSEAIKEQQ